uniref:Uncharacterized protein n=1 Tax=Lepeophtheirus salmonis TaxID=72036 RepID=A0A0K2V6T8_LEPSM
MICLFYSFVKVKAIKQLGKRAD